MRYGYLSLNRVHLHVALKIDLSVPHQLGLYVHLVGFYKSDVGIRKFLIFAKVTGQNNSKIQYGRHFKTVSACKIGKNQNF